jgi:hypothetical protein
MFQVRVMCGMMAQEGYQGLEVSLLLRDGSGAGWERVGGATAAHPRLVHMGVLVL